MDPRMTDEEIKASFTPWEQEFYVWQMTGGTGADEKPPHDDLPYQRFFDRFYARFPGPDAFDQFYAFSNKWWGRHLRRMSVTITPDEFITRLRATDCKDKTRLCETKLYMHLSPVPDLLLGQSDFGGTLTRYALQTTPDYLFPDAPFPSGKPANPHSDDALERTVLAIDINVDDPTSEPTAAQPTLNLPQDPHKRRRENVSSGEESAISMRSAESDDFLAQKPFVFFQIGALLCCTDTDEQIAMAEMSDEANGPEYESTGYGVVVRLDNNGYPTGPVYIVYNYQEALPPLLNPDPDKPSFWQERQWRDQRNQELPEIRRLYPLCDRKFFLAKIADNLSNLNADTKFDIQVVSEQRKMVVSAKRVGIRQAIIPTEIMAEARNDDFKRGRGDVEMD